MVQWAALAELEKEANVFTKLIFCLFGVYVWEIFQTSGFEWSLISGARRFTWPLSVVFFFLCRYCLLFALIGEIISFQVTTPINCGALYTFNSWTGNMAILSASTSLMIRTAALWQRRRAVVIPLVLLGLGHWAILWRGMFLIKATYSPEEKGCSITGVDHIFLNVSFFSTMGVDLTVLVLTIAALARNSLHSQMWKLLFQDGLIYFCITFACNAVPAILNVLNLNSLMNVIATIPAATISSIAACRLVMRLHNHAAAPSDVYVHSAAALPDRLTALPGSKRYTARAPEIHVTTDRITVEDFPSVPAKAMGRGRASKVSFDFPYDSEPGYEK